MNDSQNSSTRRGRSRGRNAAIAAALVVAAGAVWFGVHKYRAGANQEGEYIFASVQQGDIEDLVTATGTLQPRDYVDVGAQVSGQVEKLYVEVGDEVKAGQILAEIDATQSAARVDANRSSLRAQESNLIDRRNSLAKAERDYQRQQNLLKEDATTQEQALNAETTLISARQAIETLEAQIEQQKANMRVEESNLKFTRIVAPIDGTVVSIAAKQGQTLNATQSAPTILRIADLSTMTVQSEVSEADVSKLTRGMTAYFTTLGSQGRRWYGTLKRIEPTPKVQNSVVLYNALFDVENDGRSLMPSMTAQVFFVRADARGVLVMPMAALQQGQQIAREMAMKEREQNAAEAAGATTPGDAGAAAAGAPAADGSAAVAQTGSAAAPAEGAAPGAGREGRGGQEGGGFGGPRGAGGFNGQAPTPEQIEQFRRMREQRMAQGGGEGGAGFGRGNFGPGGMMGMGGRQGEAQQRRGMVMVKKADGTLERRDVVIGVTNRVHGQVLEGMKEGEEVVIGRREDPASAAASATGQQPNQQNQQFRPGQGFPAGGFRPF